MDGMEKMITLTPSAFRVEFPWNAGGLITTEQLQTINLPAFHMQTSPPLRNLLMKRGFGVCVIASLLSPKPIFKISFKPTP
jgi:hypothetical protein